MAPVVRALGSLLKDRTVVSSVNATGGEACIRETKNAALISSAAFSNSKEEMA